MKLLSCFPKVLRGCAVVFFPVLCNLNSLSTLGNQLREGIKKNCQTLDIVQTMGSEQAPTFFFYECLDISLMGRGVRALCPK